MEKSLIKRIISNIFLVVGIAIMAFGILFQGISLKENNAFTCYNNMPYVCSAQSASTTSSKNTYTCNIDSTSSMMSTIVTFTIVSTVSLKTSSAVVSANNGMFGYKIFSLIFESYDPSKNSYSFFFIGDAVFTYTAQDFRILTVETTAGNTLQFENAYRSTETTAGNSIQYSPSSTAMPKPPVWLFTIPIAIFVLVTGLIIIFAAKAKSTVSTATKSVTKVAESQTANNSESFLICKYCGISNDLTAKKCSNCSAPLQRDKKSK